MTSNEVIIIDYGISNILSVQHGFEEIGVNAIITSDPSIIEQARHLVLPGVGAFAKAMSALENLNLINSITKAVKNGVPFLGICLGMQLLFESSTEFSFNKGLGIFKGDIKSLKEFNSEKGIKDSLKRELKLPHMGWNFLSQHFGNNKHIRNSSIFIYQIRQSFLLKNISVFNLSCYE